MDVNIFQKYGVKKYLSSLGLSVHPRYRGRGIAKYLLLARDAVCQQANIRVTATDFVSNASIVVAKRVGFKYENGIRY